MFFESKRRGKSGFTITRKLRFLVTRKMGYTVAFTVGLTGKVGFTVTGYSSLYFFLFFFPSFFEVVDIHFFEVRSTVKRKL